MLSGVMGAIAGSPGPQGDNWWQGTIHKQLHLGAIGIVMDTNSTIRRAASSPPAHCPSMSGDNYATLSRLVVYRGLKRVPHQHGFAGMKKHHRRRHRRWAPTR